MEESTDELSPRVPAPSDRRPALEGVRYELSVRPRGTGELGPSLLAFEGTARWWDEQQGGVRLVGEIRGYRLDLLGAEDASLDQRQLLRGVSAEIAEFADQVLGEGPCELPAAPDVKDAEPLPCECILHIAELWVDAELRGRGIGTALLRQLGATLDLTRCLLVVKAVPLASAYPLPLTRAEMEGVRQFYLTRGFEPVGEGFMVKDARQCEAVRRRLAARAKAAGG